MKTRGFVIRNFRNLGLCEGDKSQEAFLRLSGAEGEVGGLMILLGENGSGKSNLLDALAKFGNCEDYPLDDKDIPSFSQYRDCLPAISFKYRILAYYLHYPQDVANRSGDAQRVRAKGQQVDFDVHLKELQRQFDSLNIYIEHCKNEEYDMKLILQDQETEHGRFLRCKTEPFKTRDDFLPPGKIRVGKSERLYCPLVVGYDEFDVQQNIAAYLDKQTQQIESQSFKEYCAVVSLETDKKTQQKYTIGHAIRDGEYASLIDVQAAEIPNQNMQKVFERKIIFCKELDFKDDALSTTPDKLADSKFFQLLFYGIYGKEGHLFIHSIQDAYKHQDEIEELPQLEDSINEKLQEMNQYFNSLYGKMDTSGAYCFEIRFDFHRISLHIRKDRQRLSLEKQSAGFRKLFGFLLQLVYDKKIQNGTMMLIDDVEAHLSVSAQRALRKFLKEFGQKNGILFIASTHSPFMIDCNCLDEIRLLKARENGHGTEIVNDVSLANLNQIDYLPKHTIRTQQPDCRLVLVEGVAICRFLSAFALMYAQEKGRDLKLVFLPVPSLNNQQERTEMLETLIDFNKSFHVTPTIFVVDKESDWEYNKKIQILVVRKNETETGFKYLFSQQDRERFGIGGANEARFLQYSPELVGKLDQKTKDEFYSALEFLHKEAYQSGQNNEDGKA